MLHILCVQERLKYRYHGCIFVLYHDVKSEGPVEYVLILRIIPALQWNIRQWPIVVLATVA